MRVALDSREGFWEGLWETEGSLDAGSCISRELSQFYGAMLSAMAPPLAKRLRN